MKKLLILALLLCSAYQVRSNIVWTGVYISELLVIDSANWTLELGFMQYQTCDSIIIETSYGTCKVVQRNICHVPPGYFFDSLMLITPADLDAPLLINPDGDILRVRAYPWIPGVSLDEFILPFGNAPGSKVGCALPGESIAALTMAYSLGFAINTIPNLGTLNDTSGACCTVQGALVYQDGTPLPPSYELLLPNEYGGLNAMSKIQNGPDGTFHCRILATTYLSHIVLSLSDPPWHKTVETLPVFAQCFRPDSVYELGSLFTSIVSDILLQPRTFDNIVTITPNPFRDEITFFFRRYPVMTSDFLLRITDLNGKVLNVTQIPRFQTHYTWTPDSGIASGVLLYNLSSEGQELQSGKMIKQ